MASTKTILSIIAILLLAACTPVETPQEKPSTPEQPKTTQSTLDAQALLATYDPNKQVAEQTFATEDDLQEFLNQHSQAGHYGYGNIARSFGGAVEEMAMDAAVAPAAAPTVAQAKSAPTDFSQTNNQVAEVDEADIIKTDGDYIYTVTGQTVFIIDAFPAQEAEVVSQINLQDRITGLFIQDDTLAVFGNVQSEYDYAEILPRRPQSGAMFLKLYDITNRNDPKEIKEYKFEGAYFQARLHDGYAYFVTLTNNYGITGTPRPFIIEDDQARHVPLPDIAYFSIPYDSPQFATIHALNLEAPKTKLNSKAILVEGGQTMYMAPDNMYIVHTKHINEYDVIQRVTIETVLPMLSSNLQDRVNRIQDVSFDILSKREKQQKVIRIIEGYVATLPEKEQEDIREVTEEKVKLELEQYEHFEFTVIHKVHVDEEDIEIVATAEVPGTVHNQFALDEYQNTLRVATTLNQRWSTFAKRTESSNNVYTLDKEMQLLDELTDIAPTERIFSTRFVGDRLYMVTFRQVDPFFTIDLSNPKKIKLLGELKIPGFSRYLHPYDDNTIIGIGRDATLEGRQQGLKISLFDVSNVNKPKETATYVLDTRYAQSSAEYEHKAFLFSREKNLLAIPLFSYAWREDQYNGALVFKITEDEITLRGLVDHSSEEENYWQNRVERSLYIEDNLYTKSPNLLRINKIEDLSPVQNVKLKPKQIGDIPIY